MKYIQSPRPELYDLAVDPNERRDLVTERPATAADLDRRLAEIRPVDESFGGEVIVLSADEEAALLALGYVTGSPGEGAGSRRNPADAIAPRAHPPAGARGQGEGRSRGGGRSSSQRSSSRIRRARSLLWYLGTCVVESDPKRARSAFRRAMELRPDFEAPYIALAELFLRQGSPAAASCGGDGGDWFRPTTPMAGSTICGPPHRLQIGGRTDEVLRDLDVALERAARPGPVYLLRAADPTAGARRRAGALTDLESFAEWSAAEEVSRLGADPRFESLHGNPRFDRLVEIDNVQ